MEYTEQKHPAYGVATFHRVTGNPGHLFGSSVDCEHFIELEIKPGMEVKSGTYHTYSDTGESFIRVAFSPAQFAELLTSMNIGKGVPCTIRRLNNVAVEKIPDELHQNEVEKFQKSYREKVQEVVLELNKMKQTISELLKQPRLNKEQKEELGNMLNKGIQEITKNIPYYIEVLDETAEKIVQEAKAEIDATVQHCVMDAGIKALGKEFKQNQIEEK